MLEDLISHPFKQSPNNRVDTFYSKDVCDEDVGNKDQAVVGENGIEILILLSAKVKELLAVLKEELYGPPLGINFYYLLACERGIGAQKDHPLIGLFRFGKHQGYRLKVRDFNHEADKIKPKCLKVFHAYRNNEIDYEEFKRRLKVIDDEIENKQEKLPLNKKEVRDHVRIK